MKCPVEYWIWLQRTLGAGKRLNDILSFFGDPVRMYEAGRNAWLASGVINKATADKLTRYSPSQSYDVMKICRENGWHIVTCDDENYPERLRDIYGFPAVLYVWGDPSVLLTPVCISIVGTRHASDYGLQVSGGLSYSLAEAGAAIVSGGALGVDSMAHSGALNAGGKTIAFLGCGLGYPYLKENGPLRRKIARSGAVVSEYIPFSPPTKQSFPIRNRLIAGLSLGTVVIEAGEKSGSLITARLALEQGRDVFAVPGDVMNSNHFGTNSLIRDGAKTVFSYMDILDEYLNEYGKYLKTGTEYLPIKVPDAAVSNAAAKNMSAHHEKTVKKTKTAVNKTVGAEEKQISEKTQVFIRPELPSYATENAKKVFSFLSEEPMLADKLIDMTKLPVGDVLSSLTELEMYRLVTVHSGKRYSIKI